MLEVAGSLKMPFEKFDFMVCLEMSFDMSCFKYVGSNFMIEMLEPVEY